VIAARQARKGRWRQEDVGDLPTSSTVASKECKQRKEGVQTLDGNPLTSLITSPQKYENKGECLKENMNIQDKSLSLQSQKFEGQRDKIWKTVQIQTVPLNAQRTGDIARNMMQNPKIQGRKIHDNSSCGIENFVPVGKDFNEKDSKLKEMFESVMGGQQVVSIYGTYINIVVVEHLHIQDLLTILTAVKSTRISQNNELLGQWIDILYCI
jgi:hypothetical protein